MSKPRLLDRLARWYLQLQQFEIIYVSQKAVKRQMLADFLAYHPLPAKWELCDELPDEDVMNVEMMPPWKIVPSTNIRIRSCHRAKHPPAGNLWRLTTCDQSDVRRL
ncbi:hypothetical protein LIER_18676 [Lithospermum erythrorhizon]|uniref:Uncharacterized protein n=1 Tax=Lithospermum erythrorhizon TaxID=34254 RepID=A0AAV3QH87_LITER